MYYIKKENNLVFVYQNILDLYKAHGVEVADLEVDELEYQEAEGLIRIIDEKIFLGKTPKEKDAEYKLARVQRLKQNLVETDYIPIKIAEGSASKKDYEEKIKQRKEWRTEIKKLEEELKALQ